MYTGGGIYAPDQFVTIKIIQRIYYKAKQSFMISF